MQDLLTNFQSYFLNIYLAVPFVFALLFALSVFIKNPVHTRRITSLLFTVCLIISFALFCLGDNISTTILGKEFSCNRISSVFSFVLSFLMLLISVFSKTFIFKLNRMFTISLFVIYGLLNSVLMADSIFCLYISLIWLIFIFYFLYTSYSYKETNKKDIFYQVTFDTLIILISLFLIGWDFLRYFILNEIPFNFSSLSENINHINPISVYMGFFGLMLIIFRFFNFLPFIGKTLSISKNVNPLVHILITVSSLIAGGFLTIKTYCAFADAFFYYQEIIAAFLLLNYIYFVILSLRQDSLIKFSSCIVPAFIIISLFNLFTFKENGLTIFVYSLLANIVSYCFLSFTFAVLAQKSRTDNIDEIKKINPKNKILIFFTMLSILNLAGIPAFCIFSSRFYTFINVFGYDHESFFMNLTPLILIAGCLVLTLSAINILYKILISPIEKTKAENYLCKNQVGILTLLLFTVLITGLFAKDICAMFIQIFTIAGF